MRVQALVGFSGYKLSMYKGEIREVTDNEVLDDLLNANYIEEIEEIKPTKKKAVKKDEGK